MRKTISLVLAVLMMLVLIPFGKLNSAVADDGAKSYALVTSAEDLTANGTYLLASAGGAGSAYALGKQNSNNRAGVAVTITSDLTIELTADQIAAASDDAKVFELTLGGNATDGWSFFDAIGNGYLYAPGTGNHLRTQATNDDKGLFTITFTEQGLAIVSKGDDVSQKNLRYNPNNGNPIFSCYKDDSSVKNLVYLYKLSGEVAPSPDPEPEPEPEPVATLTATLKEGGLDAGDKVVVYNPDGKAIMSTIDYLYNNTKHQLKPLSATLDGDELTFPEEDAAILTVKTTTGSDDIVRYTFVNGDGKYLECDGTHVQFVDTETANTLFQLEAVGSAKTDWYLKCDTAVYTDGSAQYIRYAYNTFQAYSFKTGQESMFDMQFYAIGADEPAVEPTGDTIILFTNDVHCGIRDGWGYAGVADLKKTLEAEGNEVLLVDAGDHVQGGPIGSLTQGEAIIDIMNFVGYDLATLGNHEFDYGMDQAFKLIEQAKYPYVSANFMDLTKDAPVLDAYKIFEVNEKKIAFVGISTPESITKSTPTYFMNEAGEYIYGFCQDDTGAGVYTAVQAAIDAAKAAGADYIIAVGHMGIDEQSQPWTAPEVIANTTGLDAFIDGHSHSVINAVKVADKDGKEVLHGQTGTKLANVGKLTIKADGTITMELLPASEKVKDDPETDAYIKTIENEFEALLNTVVAHTDHLLTINDADGNRWVRKHETNLGDLCADAYRYMFDSDIAFVNGGGVRANIPEGDITFQQIINVHPFGNTAVLAEVTGQQILDALEMGARVCPSENGGFLQVAGLKYEIHTYVEPNCVVGSDKMWAGPVDPEGEYRVQNVQILNKETNEYEPLDLTKKYTLASHNYMLKDMGDGFAMFGPNITILEDSGKLDNQVLIDYIQSMPAVDGVHQVEGYVAPEGEGRITIISNPAAKIFGEDVESGDITEYVDGKTLLRYDIKIANVPADTEVVGLQAFVEYDTNVLKFIEAKSELEGSTGINTIENKLLFAWASNGEGIKLDGETVIVSLYFELAAPVEDGTVTEIKFTTNTTDATSGYSYVSDSTVVEAAGVETVDGSITFAIPTELTLYGEDVTAADVMVDENGETLYRYDIKVKDLPEGGLMIDGAQIFLTYDKTVFEFRKAEGKVDWQMTDKGSKLMAVWASDSEVLLKNEEVVLSVYFAALEKIPFGTKVDIEFTTNILANGSGMSFVVGGRVIDIEATTVNGSITFVGLYGDANCDGQVTAADAAAILRALVDLAELSNQGMINADVDGDGEVTAADASAILRYIVKLIEKFPVEEP